MTFSVCEGVLALVEILEDFFEEGKDLVEESGVG